jgi:aryl-alcohol dehydrogenase-like predicted oxidoreductase
MRHRKFGNTDLVVSELGLGCSRLGGNLERGSEKESVETLLKAFDSGINFYDTADSYGQGKSETLLGKTFKQKRDRVILASKAGYCLSSLGSVAARIKPLIKPLIQIVRPQKKALLQTRGALLKQNFSSDYIRQSVEGSLKRLQTDYLDIFQLHSPTSEVLASGEIFETLDALKTQGKFRYYGVSCDTVEDALLCLNYPGVSSIQIEINVLEQDAIAKLLPLAKAANKAVIARQPFASGRLFQSQGSQDGDQTDQIKNQKLQVFTEQSDRSITQTALQFLLQLDGISVVIPGASRPKHLQENLEVFSAKPFTEEELQYLLSV